MAVRRDLGTAEWKRTRRDARIRDGGRCVVCGSTRNLVGGHRVPAERYAGRKADPGNVWTLCQSCNVAQGNRTDAEWKLTESYRRRVAARAEQPSRLSIGRPSVDVLRGDYS
jgi:5-methylcytosine-specific restriction endonuclease McrA